MLDKLTSADFLPQLHQPFVIRLDGIALIELELASVTDLGAAPLPEMRRPFSLLYLGPASNQYLQQGTYRLENEQLGALELFIAPLGPRQGRMEYEAIFT